MDIRGIHGKRKSRAEFNCRLFTNQAAGATETYRYRCGLPALGERVGSAQLVDADQVARGIAEGAVANPVRLLGRLLDDFGAAGL